MLNGDTTGAQGGAGVTGRVSLRVTLTALAACAVAAVLAVTGVVAVTSARANLTRQARQRLLTDAVDLINRPFTVTPLATATPPAPVVELFNADRQPVVRAAADTHPAPPLAAPRTRPQQVLVLPAGGTNWLVVAEPVHYRVWRIPFAFSADDAAASVTGTSRPGHPGLLLVALDLSGVDRTVETLTVACAMLGCVTLAAVTAGSAVLLHALTRPLTELAQTIETISAHGLSGQVPDRLARGELAPVARSVNTALQQTNCARAARTAAEAAARSSTERMLRQLDETMHRLRTSINVVLGAAAYHRQRGRSAARRLGPDWADRVLRRVADETAHMTSLVDKFPEHGAPDRRTRHSHADPSA